MASQSRKRRGYATQALVADYFRAHGWPYAESTGAGRQGSDVTGMPSVDIEVKATSRFEPLAWLKQMYSRCTGTAADPDIVAGVWRPNGYGPKSIDRYPVILDLATFAQLLIDAGYGDAATAEANAARDNHADMQRQADGATPPFVIFDEARDWPTTHLDSVITTVTPEDVQLGAEMWSFIDRNFDAATAHAAALASGRYDETIRRHDAEDGDADAA